MSEADEGVGVEGREGGGGQGGTLGHAGPVFHTG